jgi:transcriptional regulator GlxA family with amidase domain
MLREACAARSSAFDELAEAVALAPRTFARRMAATCGLTPIQFVQRIRVETARYLPETMRLCLSTKLPGKQGMRSLRPCAD